VAKRDGWAKSKNCHIYRGTFLNELWISNLMRDEKAATVDQSPRGFHASAKENFWQRLDATL
jgi:hypothetical protein